MFEQNWFQSADVDQLFDMRFISSTIALWVDYSLLFRHMGYLPSPLFALCFLKPLSNFKWVQQKENKNKKKKNHSHKGKKIEYCVFYGLNFPHWLGAMVQKLWNCLDTINWFYSQFIFKTSLLAEWRYCESGCNKFSNGPVVQRSNNFLVSLWI